jgi:hypothetical protein
MTWHNVLRTSFSVTVRLTVLLTTLLILAGPCIAEEHQVDKANDNTGFSEQSWTWFVDNRDYWGQVIHDTAMRLDSFFADDDAISRTNNSFLRIRLKGYQSVDNFTLIPDAKFRIDLPTLKERVNLVFENETEEDESLTEQTLSSLEATDRATDTAVGAIKIKGTTHRNWDTSTSAGVRLKLPADAFWRGKFNYKLPFSNYWQFYNKESIYYFHQSGWGVSSELNIERAGEVYLLRQSSKARYVYDDRTLEFSHVYSLAREIGAVRALKHEIGLIGKNQPDTRITNYFVRSTYRKRLYSDWLFYELSPELRFPREEEYELTPYFAATIEVIFSTKGP